MTEAGSSAESTGRGGRPDDAPVSRRTRVGASGPRVLPLIVAIIIGLLSLPLLAGGAWGLWKDRVDRHGGFISIGTTELRTDTYAIVSDLKGDGPGWLYGSRLLGDARVRATSLSDRPIFIGVARTDDVSRYLEGVGHGTIEHLVTGELSSTAGGHAPSSPPAHALTWAASADGAGEQTLVWTRGAGDWSIVLMNSDASAGVGVRGDLGAELPPLPWVALGLLIAGAVLAAFSGWFIVREIRRA